MKARGRLGCLQGLLGTAVLDFGERACLARGNVGVSSVFLRSFSAQSSLVRWLVNVWLRKSSQLSPLVKSIKSRHLSPFSL